MQISADKPGITHAEWLKLADAHRLHLLADAKNAAKSAKRMRRKISGAVNWADLDAVDCEIHLSENRKGQLQEWYVITVSEASPDASELCNYISNKLHALGYADIIVNTD